MSEVDEVGQLARELVEGLATEKETLARELGVSYASLYAWCTGRRRVGASMLIRMSELAQERARRLEDLAARLRAAGMGSRPSSVD